MMMPDEGSKADPDYKGDRKNRWKSHAQRRARHKQQLEAAITKIRQQAAVLSSFADAGQTKTELAARLEHVAPCLEAQISAAQRGEIHHSSRRLVPESVQSMAVGAKHIFSESISTLHPAKVRKLQRTRHRSQGDLHGKSEHGGDLYLHANPEHEVLGSTAQPLGENDQTCKADASCHRHAGDRGGNGKQCCIYCPACNLYISVDTHDEKMPIGFQGVKLGNGMGFNSKSECIENEDFADLQGIDLEVEAGSCHMFTEYKEREGSANVQGKDLGGKAVPYSSGHYKGLRAEAPCFIPASLFNSALPEFKPLQNIFTETAAQRFPLMGHGMLLSSIKQHLLTRRNFKFQEDGEDDVLNKSLSADVNEDSTDSLGKVVDQRDKAVSLRSEGEEAYHGDCCEPELTKYDQVARMREKKRLKQRARRERKCKEGQKGACCLESVEKQQVATETKITFEETSGGKAELPDQGSKTEACSDKFSGGWFEMLWKYFVAVLKTGKPGLPTKSMQRRARRRERQRESNERAGSSMLFEDDSWMDL